MWRSRTKAVAATQPGAPRCRACMLPRSLRSTTRHERSWFSDSFAHVAAHTFSIEQSADSGPEHLGSLTLFCFRDRIEIIRPTLGVVVQPSSLAQLLRPLLTSDSRLQRPLRSCSTAARRQISPGIAHPPSRLCASDLRHRVPDTFRALHLFACSPRGAASIRFLFVAPALCFRLPSDLQSPREPLPSANTSPCRVCRGLPPPSECALPGAQKEAPLEAGLHSR